MTRAADPYRDTHVIDSEAYKLSRRLTGRPFVSCPLPPQPGSAAAP